MSRDIYEVIYLLKPVKEVEPDWWKLKWRPLWNQTYFAYWMRRYPSRRWWADRGLGFRVWDSSANNGWGRSYAHVHLEISLLFGSLNFWIRWNFIVHKDGPLDLSPRRPLPLPEVGA